MTNEPSPPPRDPNYPPQAPPLGPEYGPGAYGEQPPPPPGGAYGPPYGTYGQQGQYGQYPPYGGGTPGAGAYAAAALGPPVPAGMGNIWQKWVNVTTKPSVASFVRELPTANWRDIWLSLIGLGILSAITGFISSLYTTAVYTMPQANGTQTTIHVPAAANWFTVVTVPLFFFIGVGILFVVAKIFGGTGTFLEQSYATMLYYVPIHGVTAILGLIPFAGGLVALALGIYEIVLSVLAIAASQRLSIGKSVAVVIIPALVVLVLLCGLILIVAAAIAAAVNGSGQ